MEFFVIHHEKIQKVYDFKNRAFVNQNEIRESCFLPTVDLAYKIAKYQHLFIKNPSLHILKVKKVKVTKDGTTLQELEELMVSF